MQQSTNQQGQFYPTREQFLDDFDCNTTVLIGRGTFGNVFKMKCKSENNSQNSLKSGQFYAVKHIEAVNEKIFQKIQNEFFINKLIERHENIVTIEKVYAWQELMPTKFILVLVMELADHSLHKEIENRRKVNFSFSDDELRMLFHQCFEAFSFLVKKKIYHRDIKPENILIIKDETLKVKITDFGLSKTLIETKIQDSLKNTLVGTPVYLSPILWKAYIINKQQKKENEKIKHDLEKSDVYSLGVSFLQCVLLLTQEICGLNQEQGGVEKTQFLISKITNPWIQSILSKMLEFEEEKRANYAELISILSNRSEIESQFKRDHQASTNLELYENIFCSRHAKQILTHFCYANEVKRLLFIIQLFRYICSQCLDSMEDSYKKQLLSLPNLLNTQSISANGMNSEGNAEILDYLTFKLQLILAEAVKSCIEGGSDKSTLDLKLEKLKEQIYVRRSSKKKINLENFQRILSGKKVDEQFATLVQDLINKAEVHQDLQQVIQILSSSELFTVLKNSLVEQLKGEDSMMSSQRSHRKKKIFEDIQQTQTQKMDLFQSIGPSILIKKKGMKVVQETYIQLEIKIEYLHFLDDDRLLVSIDNGSLNLVQNKTFFLLYKCLHTITAIYSNKHVLVVGNEIGEIHILSLKDQTITVQNIIKDNSTPVTSIHYNVYSQLLYITHSNGIIYQFNNLEKKSINTKLQNINKQSFLSFILQLDISFSTHSLSQQFLQILLFQPQQSYLN